MTKSIWKCPACGHRFATRNMWHSCGRYRVADHFAGKDPVVKQMYQKFIRFVRSCGRITVYAQKTRIVCMVDVRFAGAMARKRTLECGLWLNRRAGHPALVRVESLGGSSFANYFRFTEPAQLDRAFAKLVKEAYDSHALTARERREAT